MSTYPVYVETVSPPPMVLQPPPAVAVVQNPTPVVMQQPLKSTPCRMRCKYCSQEIVTVTQPVMGLLTWVVFGVLFVFMIWPFCLIPFFVSSCKDIKHTCPSCSNVLHVHKRM